MPVIAVVHRARTHPCMPDGSAMRIPPHARPARPQRAFPQAAAHLAADRHITR
ncbi:hypothetical protein [Paraburkholderia terricola]|jgi:hypothetical protein|uniref:hypothetical protein n=1 Tax=Paraburkholderia terricola TaxID=169427 RepID=UPI0013562C90|nr:MULTISPECIES: hypothetical protein [Paraburkholderia]